MCPTSSTFKMLDILYFPETKHSLITAEHYTAAKIIVVT